MAILELIIFLPGMEFPLFEMYVYHISIYLASPLFTYDPFSLIMATWYV